MLQGLAIKVTPQLTQRWAKVPAMAETADVTDVHSLTMESLKEWLLKQGIAQGVVDALYGMPETVKQLR